MKKLILIGLSTLSLTTYASEIEQLKEELKRQQEVIYQLQEKVKQLQNQQEIAEKTREKLNKLHQSPLDKILSDPFSQKKFLPDVSLVLDFSYVSRNLTDKTYREVMIPGFNHGFFHSHEDHGHFPYNAERGFNLNYGELYLTHAVDPYFDLVGIFHLSERGFNIEEGYFRTKGLPANLQIKGGKFYSKFGRLNEFHPHYWDFVDAPLVYRATFGEHNLLEKGAQLTWLAPTPFYLLLGVEAFQGDNEHNFNRNGFVVNTKKDGTGTYVEVPDTKKPNLYTFFIKPSFDVGRASILGGLSYAEGKTRINHLEDQDPHAFTGTTKIYGLDLTVRYTLGSYRYITWQSEYIQRDVKGTRFGYDNSNNLVQANLQREQSGFYSQVVYKFAPRWRVGARYDLINKNDTFINGVNRNLPDNLYRYSAMIDFLPSEFSRIRLQYNYDKSLFLQNGTSFERKTNHEVILQFNMLIGAHGAHGF